MHEQKVVDDIARCGWHCVNILEEGESPPYSFTVGLFHTYGHPELIVFGLPAQTAHQILSLAADAAARGQPLDLACPTDELLEGYSCCFAQVPRAQYFEHVGFCRWYYMSDAFPLYQVVWPSKAGQFPWHPDASPEFRAAQPVIAEISSGA